MGKHTKEEAMTIRARVSAWAVFISMAGTTMSFQVYHSIEVGHMPWVLAVLYGIIPLFISMLLIDVVSGWSAAPKWIRWAAYLIIGGAMYLSASATGAVVFRAAPKHSSLLFGLLLDGAAILAARYLMTTARKDADVEAVALVDVTEVDALQAELAGERRDREAVAGERDTARAEAAAAAAKTETLTRQLADSESRKPTGNGGGNRPRKATVTGVKAAKVTADLDSYAEALRILGEEPGISASELGRRLGRSESRGRQIMRDLTKAAPQGPDEGA